MEEPNPYDQYDPRDRLILRHIDEILRTDGVTEVGTIEHSQVAELNRLVEENAITEEQAVRIIAASLRTRDAGTTA